MQTIKSYLNALGADTVSPGGGSAAALVVALGTALVQMTAGLNARRELKKTGKVSPAAVQRLKRLKRMVSKLQWLMEEDTLAFKKISLYFKSGRKGTAYQRALKGGVSVPLEICEQAAEAAKIGLPEISRTSRWLASDLAEGGVLLASGFRAARFNVEINLGDLKDKKYAKGVVAKLKRLERSVESGRSKFLKGVR